jgi:hypothetical protein
MFRYYILLLTGFVVSTSHVQAGFYPWSYRNPTNEIATTKELSGGFTFSNESFSSTDGNALIQATKIYSWSTADEANPDRITALPYHFGLEIRDDLTAQTAQLSFEGNLTGRFWGTGSALTNTFTGDTTQTAQLGGREYAVSLTDFTAPTGTGLDHGGSINASVTVRSLSEQSPVETPPVSEEPTEPVQTPEPTSLLLAAVGLPALWMARKRRVKQTDSYVECQ